MRSGETIGRGDLSNGEHFEVLGENEPTPVERVDLSGAEVIEPRSAFRVNSDHFGIAEYDPDAPDKRYFITLGVSGCKALGFGLPLEDEEGRRVLLAHISTLNISPSELVEFLAEEFGKELIQDADAYLVMGRQESMGTQWPTFDALKRELLRLKPKRLIIEDQRSEKPRGVGIDLLSGEMVGLTTENPKAPGWGWYEGQDTTSEKDIPREMP